MTQNQVPGQMRAGLVEGPGTVRVIVVERPEPAAGEVLIHVHTCGLCASEVDVYAGHNPWAQFPARMGHEVTGDVVAFGPLLPGQEHPSDATGQPLHLGQPVAAATAGGGYAEYTCVPARALLPLPADLRDRALVEPLGCAVNTVRAVAPAPDDGIVVLGAGFMGLLLISLLRATAAPRYLLAVARRPEALDLALVSGATNACTLDEAQDRGGQLSDYRGADIVLEATGHNDPLARASGLCREGATLGIVGYHQGEGRQIPIHEWNWKALRIVNAHFRDDNQIIDGARRGLDLLQRGIIDTHSLISHRFALDDLPDAFAMAAQHPQGFIKAAIFMR